MVKQIIALCGAVALVLIATIIAICLSFHDSPSDKVIIPVFPKDETKPLPKPTPVPDPVRPDVNYLCRNAKIELVSQSGETYDLVLSSDNKITQVFDVKGKFLQKGMYINVIIKNNVILAEPVP